MEVIKGKLYFRQQLVLWDKNNNPVEIKDAPEVVKIFQRVKSESLLPENLYLKRWNPDFGRNKIKRHFRRSALYMICKKY